MQPLGAGKRNKSILLKTGQTTQYSSEFDDGYYQKGIAKSYTVLSTGTQSGTSNVDLAHLVSDTGAFTAADQKYTDAGKCGVFKTGGGETIIITGSASNNGTFTTIAADANTVTFASGIENEADAPATTFAKREAMSNNVVIDNNTSVMANGSPLYWLRYSPTKMGIAGDGKVPWTGQIYDVFALCAAINAASVGGYNDWRVPNAYEAETLRDCEATRGYPDSTAFPSWTSASVWTSTTRASDATNALNVTLYDGGSSWAVHANTRATTFVRG